METLVFVFPGQGSQREGMGADLLSRDPLFRRMVGDANSVSGIDVLAALTAPDDQAPAPTVATQLSVFALSVSLGRILLDRGVVPDALAGHSLGEFSALVVGGWLDVDDGLSVVAARAAAMERCCSDHDGSMVAVTGLPHDALDRALGETSAVLANRNSPRQIVVSGARDAVAATARTARDQGARSVVELPVAGAFHSPLVAPAEEALRDHVHRLALRQGEIPLITSVTGELVDDVDRYREDLARQITSPVQWAQVMASIAELDPDGAPRVVEVGPGAVLRGLFRHVDRGWPVTTCGSLDDCGSHADDLARVPA